MLATNSRYWTSLGIASQAMAGRSLYVMSRRVCASIFSCRHSHQHRLSNIFKPLNVMPKGAVKKSDEAMSISQKLLVDLGITSLRSNGMYAMLPLGQRVLNKLTALIDEEMARVDSQRFSLPHLTKAELWRITGRWESTGEELFRTEDRRAREYVLSPTHEEAVANLLSDVQQLSFRELPLRLYQISSKFRDEINPRFGLLRCREFLMKDLYTFDKSEDEAVCTYNDISGAYGRLFQRIGVPFIKVAGDCGSIGGDFSHEYHYQAAIGEDTLLLCQTCGYATNAELLPDSNNVLPCPKCKSQVDKISGIEVGHTFLLGTRYSKPLQACYRNENGKPEVTWMGCYGVGVSRVMAAVVEVLSHPDSIVWPWMLAPFKVCIIGPKKGSRESSVSSWVEHMAHMVSKEDGYVDDIVIDDRDSLTIGRRVLEATRTGYPFILIVGKRAAEHVPIFELIDTVTHESHHLSHQMLLQYFRETVKNKQKL